MFIFESKDSQVNHFVIIRVKLTIQYVKREVIKIFKTIWIWKKSFCILFQRPLGPLYLPRVKPLFIPIHRNSTILTNACLNFAKHFFYSRTFSMGFSGSLIMNTRLFSRIIPFLRAHFLVQYKYCTRTLTHYSSFD